MLSFELPRTQNSALKTQKRLVIVPPILFYAAISLRAEAQAAPGLAGVIRPRRRGGDASERGGTNASRLPHDKPAPRTLLPLGQRSRLAAGIAADAGRLLPGPFTPSQAVAWWDYSLLPSCVAAPFPAPCPRLLFRGVAFHTNAKC